MNVVATLGASALTTALAASVVAVVASAYGHRATNRTAIAIGRRAIYAVAMLTTFAIGLLSYALIVDDFSIAHVASVSSSDMRLHMKSASLWSGQPGSLLFWTWMMSVWMAIFVRATVPKIPWGAPHAVATCGAVIGAFLLAGVAFASPFRLSPVTPADGQGLNPLLVDPGMLIHPPFLLTGLVSTSIPFVIGAAALMAGKIDNAWIRHARGWALASFLALSVGNFLGAWWAYTVLGWGGYWGWDPVENSAILPLLPLTAFLHALLVQERRGMLKSWNLILVLAAFALAVFGTFNVRSGLVASVHSFAQSEVGSYFLILLAIVVAVSVGLMVWRLPRMHADYEFESLVSRETGLILNTYVFIAIALVILGGTLFPVASELFRNVRVTVGPPFYNDTAGPLFIALLILVGIGTILPWRDAGPGLLRRRFTMPGLATLATAGLMVTFGIRDPFALATLAAATLILVTSAREYVIGTRALRTARGIGWLAAFGGIFNRDPRRYGGYLVHVGVAIMAIAIIATSVYREQVRAVVSPGETFEAGGYVMQFEDLASYAPGVDGIDTEVVARVGVYRDGQLITTMEPGRRFFTNFPEQPTAIVAVDGNLRRDLYVFVQGWDTERLTEIQVFVNPLQQWLWIGGAIYTAGGLLAFAPFRSARRVEVEVPVSEGGQPV
ncbi:MAG: heme lyase CcmF/NrfE family subunit [Chloroflexi bacterium]|nr:heme lyase CcmF/NrfE family subunit [Chloroflexota bacterium]MQC48096.1 heme lyase CcmF/NrfE family subunit [Chloroflexota bacterium]